MGRGIDFCVSDMVFWPTRYPQGLAGTGLVTRRDLSTSGKTGADDFILYSPSETVSGYHQFRFAVVVGGADEQSLQAVIHARAAGFV